MSLIWGRVGGKDCLKKVKQHTIRHPQKACKPKFLSKKEEEEEEGQKINRYYKCC